MSATSLPEDGALQIGSLRLPEGCRTHVHGSRDGSTPPVAWVTVRPVPDSGAVWAALSQIIPDTGLIPFLAQTLLDDPTRPWYDGSHHARDYFQYPADLATLDEVDPAAVLSAGWDANAGEALDEAEDESEPGWPEWAHGRIAPFSRDFPGLAPAGLRPLDQAQVRDVLSRVPWARIGLAVADRPSDALAAMGWTPGNWVDGVGQVSAVLRSWEDRFGARLIGVGLDEFTLLAEGLPPTVSAAEHLAAEIFALGADEFHGAWREQALTDVPEIAASLLDSPIWGLWWD